MDGHLRSLRKNRAEPMTLEALQAALTTVGQNKTIGYLSLIERGLNWPGREVVDAIVELFQGEITEMQILYPFRKLQGVNNDQ